jgi:hypothetical protein
MFSRPTSSTTSDACPPGGSENVAALTAQRLAELDRLRSIGFEQVRRLTAVSRLLTPEQEFRGLTATNGAIQSYARIARAIRQVVALEFELRGLFQAPDRDAPRGLRLLKPDRTSSERSESENFFSDLNDYGDLNDFEPRSDYRTGPLDAVVAGIRKTLRAEPPPDDPFAPATVRKPASPAAAPTIAPRLPTRPKIAARIRPQRRPDSAQAEPAPPQSAQAEPARKAASLAIKARGGDGFRIPAKAKNSRGRGPPK